MADFPVTFGPELPRHDEFPAAQDYARNASMVMPSRVLESSPRRSAFVERERPIEGQIFPPRRLEEEV